MHFRLPKPLHGWREFAGEVGIIVVGVLIALGAEQIVETIHAHSNGVDAQRRIRAELAWNSAQEVERLAVGRCLTQRIGAIAQGLASGRSDWQPMLFQRTPERPEALREVYHMPSRNWLIDAYQGALSQGDLNSVDAVTRASLAQTYKAMAELAQLNETEQQLSTSLAPLQFDPPLSPGERNQMIATLARLDSINGLIMLISRQQFEVLHNLGLAYSPQELFKQGSRGSWDDELKGLRGRYGNCVDASAITQYEDIAIRGAKTA